MGAQRPPAGQEALQAGLERAGWTFRKAERNPGVWLAEHKRFRRLYGQDRAQLVATLADHQRRW